MDNSHFDDNTDDIDDEAASEDDGFVDDAQGPEKIDDDGFMLEGYDDLGLPNNEQESNAEDPIDEPSAGHKRKRARISSPPAQRSDDAVEFEGGEGFVLNDDQSLLQTKSSRVLGTFGRRDRAKGDCLPAYHRRVSATLDSDDQLMMDMRDGGYTDRQIADKLVALGGNRYDPKSISTRIMRIRLAQAANVDFLLAEGYKEWEIEDDNLLMQAYAIADIETNYEVERIRAWRFRKVSEYMRRLNKDALFSATACRDRFDTITSGTAAIPTEEDDDPNARRTEREAFCFAREEVRNKEKVEKDAQEAIELKAKEDAKAAHAQRSEEVANRIADKEEATAQRLMKRAATAQIRAQKAAANRIAKTQRNHQIRKQKAAAEAKVKKAISKRGASGNVPASLPAMKDVTVATPDPRGYLSLHDLREMCADRGFDVFGKNKDKLVQELRDADEEWNKEDLTKMCKAKGIAINGTKLQMKYRMALAAAKTYPSFKAGIAGVEEEDDLNME
ncbi:hypothetical protein T440DRAFT_421304 [Plenodomus tracheiphilus IPT5]|uniref:DUF7626 domain-containing protein n=1 Tax=Plenodomus tracheiphilus IPT5 TaxID=1408161 RepID=A0A6A7BA20_9PLEO|nr:hypothetical protein T440DRAFT_421304 [Plenodomus tracheiphilus IPT5]